MQTGVVMVKEAAKSLGLGQATELVAAQGTGLEWSWAMMLALRMGVVMGPEMARCSVLEWATRLEQDREVSWVQALALAKVPTTRSQKEDGREKDLGRKKG